MTLKRKSEISQAPPGEETPLEGEPESTSEVEVEPSTTIGEETFSYSKQEHEDFINSVKGPLGRQLSDALSANTTLKTTSDAQGTRINDLEGAVNKMREERRAVELKTAEGETGLVDEIKLKHQNEDKEFELSNRESILKMGQTQHQADIDAVAEGKAKALAKELAKTSGLVESLILDIGTDTVEGRTTYNLERMKSVASKPHKAQEGEEDVVVDENDADAVAAAASTIVQKGQRARAASTSKNAATQGYRTFQDYEKAYGKGEISNEQYEEAAKRFNIDI